MRVIEYTIVLGETADHLIEAVQERIANGWQPTGGVAVGNGWRYQAMVKMGIDEDAKLEFDRVMAAALSGTDGIKDRGSVRPIFEVMKALSAW